MEPQNTNDPPEQAEAVEIPPLADFKKACTGMITELRNDNLKPMEALANFEVLLEAFTKNTAPLNSEQSPQHRRHFLYEVVMNCLNALLKRSYADIHVSVPVNETLKRVLDLVIQQWRIVAASTPEEVAAAIGDTGLEVPDKRRVLPVYSEFLHAVLDPERRFYHMNGLHDPEMIQQAHAENTAELQEWRKGLQVGDMIDVLSGHAWRSAKITTHIPKTNRFRIGFEGAKAGREEFIPAYSYRIHPHLTKSPQYLEEWRKELKKGSLLDILDPASKWYTGVVLDAPEQGEGFIPLPGDLIYVHYDEWRAKYDEHIPRCSERLAPHRSVAKGGRTAPVVTERDHDLSLQDSLDPPGVASVIRKSMNSYYFPENVNYFAEQGGFQVILQRLEVLDPWLDARTLRLIMGTMSGIADHLARPWAEEHLLRFREATYRQLLNYGEDGLRQLTKEVLGPIILGCSTIGRRLQSRDESNTSVERFGLAIALKRFQCNQIERRSDGLSHICEFATNMQGYSSVNAENFYDWLTENKILESCLVTHGHPALVAKCEDLLSFMAREKRLGEPHLQLAWDALLKAIKDQQAGHVQAIYKLLDDLVWRYSRENMEFLLSQIGKIPPQDLELGMLDLVTAFSRQSYKDAIGIGILQQVVEFLWRIAQDESGVTDEVALASAQRVQDVLTVPAARDLRIPFLQQCVENIRAHRSVPQTLTVMTKILETFGNPRPLLPKVPVSAAAAVEQNDDPVEAKGGEAEEKEEEEGFIGPQPALLTEASVDPLQELDDVPGTRAAEEEEEDDLDIPGLETVPKITEPGEGGQEADPSSVTESSAVEDQVEGKVQESKTNLDHELDDEDFPLIVAPGGSGGSAVDAAHSQVTRAHVIEMLTVDYDLIDSFFQDLDHFTSLCQERAAVLSPKSSPGGGAENGLISPEESPRSDPSSPKSTLTPAKTTDGLLSGGEIICSRHSYADHIRTRLNFISYLTLNSPKELTREQVDHLWEATVVRAWSPQVRDNSMHWFTAVCGQENQGCRVLTPEIVEYIFLEKFIGSWMTGSSARDVSGLRPSEFTAFERYFTLTNRHRGTLEPVPGSEDKVLEFEVVDFQNLVGIDALWSIVLEAEDEAVTRRSITFLNKVYERLAPKLAEQVAEVREEYIDQCMTQLQDSLTRKDWSRSIRCLTLLNNLLDATETKGVGSLRAHGNRLRGYSVMLQVRNEIRDGVGSSIYQVEEGGQTPPKTFEIRVFSNDTVWDLRKTIAQVLGVPAQLINLVTAGKTLTQEQNSKRLIDFHFTDGQRVLVNKRIVSQNRLKLLQPDGEIIPELRKALTDMYVRYLPAVRARRPFKPREPAPSPDPEAFEELKRSPGFTLKDMAVYIIACGAPEDSASDSRLQSIFTQFCDPGVTEYLSLDGFCRFYQEACVSRVDCVWADVRRHGFRDDLRKEDDVLEELMNQKQQETELPRYILASKDRYFHLLFQSLGQSLNHELSTEIWQLIQRLPTNPVLEAQLRALDVSPPSSSETGDEGFDWDSLLDSKSLYKLLYSLQILESFSDTNSDDLHHEHSPQKQQQQQKRMGKGKGEQEGAAETKEAAEAAENLASTEGEEKKAGNEASTTVSPSSSAADPSSSAPESKEDAPDALPEEEEDSAESVVPQDMTLEERLQWRRRFLSAGGFNHLYQILLSGSRNKEDTQDSVSFSAAENTGIRKECHRLLLSMVCNFLWDAMGPEKPDLFPKIERVFADALDEKKHREQKEGKKQKQQDSSSSVVAEEMISDDAHGPYTPLYPSSGGGRDRSGSVIIHGDDSDVDRTPSPAEEQQPTQDGDEDEDTASAAIPLSSKPPTLVRQLSEGIANQLLGQIDFEFLQQSLLETVSRSASADPVTRLDNQIVEHALNLWIALVLFRPAQLIPVLYQLWTADPQTYLLKALLCGASGRIRVQMKDAVTQIALHFPEAVRDCPDLSPDLLPPVDFVLGFLRPRLPTWRSNAVQRSGLYCREMFDLLAEVIRLKDLPPPSAAGEEKEKEEEQRSSAVDSSSSSPSAAAPGEEEEEKEKKAATEKRKQRTDTVTPPSQREPSEEERKLLLVLVNNLRYHRSTEINDSPKPDNVLTGSLLILNQLLLLFPQWRVPVGQDLDSLTQELSAASPSAAAAATVDPLYLGDILTEAPNTLQAETKGLVDLLFNVFLFGLPQSHELSRSRIPDRLRLEQPEDTEDTSDFPKCKTEESRDLAYQLLLTLSDDGGGPNFQILVACLLRQHAQDVHRLRGWDYSAQKQTRDSSGYVGLKNQGSTCYMNSLIQQFYMMPRFRAGVLLTEAPSIRAAAARAEKEAAAAAEAEAEAEARGDVEPSETSDSPSSSSSSSSAAVSSGQEEGDETITDPSEDLLYQFQTMFGFLTASEKQAYDTKPFCHTYKDPETGQPINVRIQQDAQEFFNVICDRLQHAMKGTPQHMLIPKLFGGKMINQFICHGGCNNVREREEDYLTSSLQVKGLRDMSTSLDAYVSGEAISNFNCEKCDRKVDITKRTVFGTLSDTIIFHLKRFEINWHTWQHVKLNEEFRFPMTLNMEPYTREGRQRLDAMKAREEEAAAAAASAVDDAPDSSPADSDGGEQQEEVGVAAAAEEEEEEGLAPLHPPEYYEYELRGVLVHSGSAQGGHYYSYIRERRPGEFLVHPEQQPPVHQEGTSSSSSETGQREPRWFEFNDHQISPFDPKDMEAKCFGGLGPVERTSFGYETQRSERIHNAYMLVYDRVKPHSGKPSNEPEAEAEEAVVAAAAASAGGDGGDGGAEGEILVTGALDADRPAEEEEEEEESKISDGVPEEALQLPSEELIPESILEEIHRDNLEFRKERQIYTAEHFRFVHHAIELALREGGSTSSSSAGGGDEGTKQPAVEVDGIGPLPPPGEQPQAELAEQLLTDPSVLGQGQDGRGGVSEKLRFNILVMGTQFAFNTLAHCAQKESFAPLLGTLSEVYGKDPTACAWMLREISLLTTKRHPTQLKLLERRRRGAAEDGAAAGEEEEEEGLVLPAFSPTLIKEHVLDCREPEHRTAVRHFFSKALQNLFRFETQLLREFALSGEDDADQQEAAGAAEDAQEEKKKPRSFILDFLRAHLSLLEEAKKTWFRFQQYFEILADFAALGELPRLVLVRLGLIERIGDLYLGDKSPLLPPGRQAVEIGNQIMEPKYSPLFQLLDQLVRSLAGYEATLLRAAPNHPPSTDIVSSPEPGAMDPPQPDTEPDDDPLEPSAAVPPTDSGAADDRTKKKRKKSGEEEEEEKTTEDSIPLNPPNELPLEDDLPRLPMPPDAQKILDSRHFYQKALGGQHALDHLEQIALFWAWKNPRLSSDLIAVCLAGVKRSGPEAVKPYLRLLKGLLGLRDELQDTRIQLTLNPGNGLLRNMHIFRIQHSRFSYNCAVAVLEMLQTNEAFARNMAELRGLQWPPVPRKKPLEEKEDEEKKDEETTGGGEEPGADTGAEEEEMQGPGAAAEDEAEAEAEAIIPPPEADDAPVDDAAAAEEDEEATPGAAAEHLPPPFSDDAPDVPPPAADDDDADTDDAEEPGKMTTTMMVEEETEESPVDPLTVPQEVFPAQEYESWIWLDQWLSDYVSGLHDTTLQATTAQQVDRIMVWEAYVKEVERLGGTITIPEQSDNNSSSSRRSGVGGAADVSDPYDRHLLQYHGMLDYPGAGRRTRPRGGSEDGAGMDAGDTTGGGGGGNNKRLRATDDLDLISASSSSSSSSSSSAAVAAPDTTEGQTGGEGSSTIPGETGEGSTGGGGGGGGGSEEWACAACTYLNPSRYVSCEICTTPRP